MDSKVAASMKTMFVNDRVNYIASRINALIDDFDKGDCSEPEVFQQELLDIIKEARLSDERWVKCLKAGVHPDYRDGLMLTPVDVHDLMLFIVMVGWSWTQCEHALACEVPPTPLGQT